MIAGGGGHNAALPLRRRQRQYLVHRASDLKGSGMLQVFKFEIYIGAGKIAVIRGMIQNGFSNVGPDALFGRQDFVDNVHDFRLAHKFISS
jgi:hypothetical protein